MALQDWLIILKDKCVNVFIFSLLLLLILPVCLIFFSFMHLIRFFVKLIAKILRPDMGNILSCGTASCAYAKSTQHDTRLVIMVTGICEGTLDIKQVKQSTRELLEIKNIDNELQYPELLQFPISWMGYLFWSWDTNFHLDNHVHLIELNKNIISESELKDIESGLINEEFKPGQSPWSITIVNNVLIGEHDQVEQQNRNSALILKISHTIGDGLSMVKLFEYLCKVTKNSNIKLTSPAIKKGFGEKIFFPFKTLYFLADGIRHGFKSQSTYPLMVTNKRIHNDLQVGHSVLVDDIKRIKEDLHVSFTSVVLALATGSIRALIIKSGLILPTTIPCCVPILRPGHPSNLRNHFLPVTINLPIGEPNQIKRVRLCHQEFQNVKSSPEPFLAALQIIAFGGCVAAVGRKLCTGQGIPVFLTYLPLDWSTSSLGGCNLKSVFGSLTMYGSLGLSLGVVSFQNHLTFSPMFDSGIITEQTASSFGKFIKAEVALLKDSGSKSKNFYKLSTV